MSTQIIIMTTSGEIKFETLEADALAQLQRIVGGLIERATPDEDIDVWANEEGLLMGLPHNPLASALLATCIVGDVAIAGHDDEGETLPAPQHVFNMFEVLARNPKGVFEA